MSANPYSFMSQNQSQPQTGGYRGNTSNPYAVPQGAGGGQQGMTRTGQSGASNPAANNNPYGTSTSMGGGAQPRNQQVQTGGYRGSAQVYQPGTGVPGRSLQQQYSIRSGTPGQGTQPGQQAQQGGNGQTSPNPDPYGQPWVDYMNPDGSPHINYQYGQSGGGGGQSSNTGPNGGSNDYWTGGGGQPQRVPVGGDNAHGPMYGNIPQGPGQQGLPFTWEQYANARNDNPRIAQEYAQMNLPYAQLSQNAYQYDRDFAESNQRDDRNYGLQYSQQQWDQGMGDRQQTAAEQQAAIASGQWDRQFAQTQGNDRFNQDFTNRSFDREGQQWNQTFGLQQNQQNFQQGLDTRGMDLQETNSTRQYGLDTRGMDLQYQNSDRQYGLDTRGMNLQELQNTQQYGLSQNQQAMQATQMAHQMGIDTRGMSLAEVTQATQAAYQQQQLTQQAALAREGYASQERQAVMQATGRQQAPAARWVRSW